MAQAYFKLDETAKRWDDRVKMMRDIDELRAKMIQAKDVHVELMTKMLQLKFALKAKYGQSY